MNESRHSLYRKSRERTVVVATVDFVANLSTAHEVIGYPALQVTRDKSQNFTVE